MYTLLVADDEKWVRHGLQLTIDWKSSGVEWVGEAEDGEEVLEFMKDREPDILITDIKMPGMDGLELLSELQKQQRHTKVIIISGYNDFSYAQKALKYGAYDYVLKPVEEHLLLEVIQRCVFDLEKEKKRLSQIKDMSGCIRESLPLARRHFLENQLTGAVILSREHIVEKWRALNINLQPEEIKVGCITIYDHNGEWADEQEKNLMVSALGNMAEEIGRKYGLAAACPLSHQDADLAVLFSPYSSSHRGSLDFAAGAMKELIESAKTFLGITITVGLSGERPVEGLSTTFREALYAGGVAFFHHPGEVYESSQAYSFESKNRFYPGPGGSWGDRVMRAVKSADAEEISVLMQELAEHVWQNQNHYVPLDIVRGIKAVLCKTLQTLEVAGSVDAEKTVLFEYFYNELNGARFVFPEFQSWLTSRLEWFSREISSRTEYNRSIQMALLYIQENYMKGITMNDVAESLFLNPSYFSKLFHEEMGETFSKYLIKIRMEKAKELLKTSMLKIYEVAECVGYSDFRHFSKTFKELEGLTPAQYRDKG